MRNVFWLRPQIIAGRTGPNQDAWDPHELAGGGIGAILSVNDGELVHPQDLAAAGIAYAHIPLSDKSPPEPGDFDTCVAALPKALEFAMTSVESDRSVLVHCRAGKDRTGMFLSYFLCKTEGLPPREAVLEVKRVRPIALTAQGWDLFTHQVLETLVAQRGRMVDVITFTTATFDAANETPNPINPIAGESVLVWLREKLGVSQYDTTDPDAEDWGWYMHVRGFGASYLVGASGEIDGDRADVDWTVQIHKQRALMEKLAGRNKMAFDDPLSTLIERIVRDDTRLEDIEVDKDA